jgi:hypothetical protein
MEDLEVARRGRMSSSLGGPQKEAAPEMLGHHLSRISYITLHITIPSILLGLLDL